MAEDTGSDDKKTLTKASKRITSKWNKVILQDSIFHIYLLEKEMKFEYVIELRSQVNWILPSPAFPDRYQTLLRLFYIETRTYLTELTNFTE